jgi:hypothetical protein
MEATNSARIIPYDKVEEAFQYKKLQSLGDNFIHEISIYLSTILYNSIPELEALNPSLRANLHPHLVARQYIILKTRVNYIKNENLIDISTIENKRSLDAIDKFLDEAYVVISPFINIKSNSGIEHNPSKDKKILDIPLEKVKDLRVLGYVMYSSKFEAAQTEKERIDIRIARSSWIVNELTSSLNSPLLKISLKESQPNSNLIKLMQELEHLEKCVAKLKSSEVNLQNLEGLAGIEKFTDSIGMMIAVCLEYAMANSENNDEALKDNISEDHGQEKEIVCDTVSEIPTPEDNITPIENIPVKNNSSTVVSQPVVAEVIEDDRPVKHVTSTYSQTCKATTIVVISLVSYVALNRFFGI